MLEDGLDSSRETWRAVRTLQAAVCSVDRLMSANTGLLYREQGGPYPIFTVSFIQNLHKQAIGTGLMEDVFLGDGLAVRTVELFRAGISVNSVFFQNCQLQFWTRCWKLSTGPQSS